MRNPSRKLMEELNENKFANGIKDQLESNKELEGDQSGSIKVQNGNYDTNNHNFWGFSENKKL